MYIYVFNLYNYFSNYPINDCDNDSIFYSFADKILNMETSGINVITSYSIHYTKLYDSFLAAYSVITGNMTLGMMIAVQYIIGQLNSPITQFIGFIQSWQDAKISLERLGEIHNQADEENIEEQKVAVLPNDKSIKIQDVEFQYDKPHGEMVLKKVSLEIPENKITAIVGTSGSGKTTMVKLMLGFYELNSA